MQPNALEYYLSIFGVLVLCEPSFFKPLLWNRWNETSLLPWKPLIPQLVYPSIPPPMDLMVIINRAALGLSKFCIDLLQRGITAMPFACMHGLSASIFMKHSILDCRSWGMWSDQHKVYNNAIIDITSNSDTSGQLMNCWHLKTLTISRVIKNQTIFDEYFRKNLSNVSITEIIKGERNLRR